MDIALRQNICRLIAGLVVADDDLAPEEDAFIDRLLARFEIPEEDRGSIFPILDHKEAAEQMAALPAAQQREAMELLLGAAVADGKVVPEERAYVRAVAAAVGLTEAAADQKLAAALAEHARR